MSSAHESDTPAKVVDLNGRAMDNIAFIRQTMERSSAFTAVPGRGLIAMGVLALIGASVASWVDSVDWWMWVWVGVAVLGFVIGTATLASKCRHEYGSVFAGPARRFGLSFAPPILAGTVLTDVFDAQGLYYLMPGTWLLLYGIAVLAGGAYSVPAVPVLGLCFIIMGSILLVGITDAYNMPIAGQFTLADAFLAAGFGGLHIGFGWFVARRYGG